MTATIALSSPNTVIQTTTAAIPHSLWVRMRRLGASTRFHPPVRGQVTTGCETQPGPREAHIELFAENQVVLIASGVGIRTSPRHCYGAAVTLDPTGVVHFRPGATIPQLFAAWGEPLSATRLASFGGQVRYYLDGRRVPRLPGLSEHAEIVLEVGPYVPPHRQYTFPHA